MKVKIGDICTLKSGTSLKEDMLNEVNGVPYVKVSDMNLTGNEKYIIRSNSYATADISSKMLFPEGTVLFPKRGGAIGTNKKRIASKVVCADLNTMGVIPSEKIRPLYLYYYFQNIDFGTLYNGSSVPQINNTDIAPMEIELLPLDKQDNVVDLLEKTDSIIRKRKAELVALDELIKARFVELFGKPIDNTMGWPIDRAEKLCVLVTDGSHFSPKACEEGYPMLSVKDMRQNGFDYSDCKLVDDETFEVLKKQGCVPQVDDVLIAKDGSYFTRAFAITEYKDQAILSSIGMYRPDLEKILPRFLASYLMTNEVVEFVNRGYVTGTALRRVIIKGLKNIPVYMPPIELQKEFVEFAEQVDKSKVVAQQALNEAQLLFDSLMQKYFG